MENELEQLKHTHIHTQKQLEDTKQQYIHIIIYMFIHMCTLFICTPYIVQSI